MNRVVEMRVQDGAATVTVNNPPVNALSAGVPEGLSTAIRSAESEPQVRAIVVLGDVRAPSIADTLAAEKAQIRLL